MKNFTLQVKINPTGDLVNVPIIIDKLKPSVKLHGFQNIQSVLLSNICRIIILATTILGATHPTGSNRFGYLI